MNKPKQFNPKQVKAIDLLAMGELTYKAICKEVKIAESTLRGWRDSRSFMDEVIARSREMLRGAIPELYSAAIREAKDGNSSFFRTLLEHIDRLEEQSKGISESSITFSWKTRDE